MEKTNFETLHIYRLSEVLADRIWNIVLNWNWLGTIKYKRSQAEVN